MLGYRGIAGVPEPTWVLFLKVLQVGVRYCEVVRDISVIPRHIVSDTGKSASSRLSVVKQPSFWLARLATVESKALIFSRLLFQPS